MRKLIVFLFLSLSFSAFAQEGETHLITPIVEGPELSANMVRSFARFQSFRNWGINRIGLDTVKQTLTGLGARACICDTGEPTHTDLRGVVVESANFSTDPAVTDGNGHSTHVTGILHEIAPDAKIYIAKVLSNEGSGSNVGVANGVNWCISKGAHIISMSLGSPSPSATLKAAIDAAVKSGALVIVAAGNSGAGEKDNIDYPGRYPETITIGSINDQLAVSWFSSSGPEGDIVAPGEKVLSNWLNNNYLTLSGTSMATPFVSGMACLYIEQTGNNYTFRSKLQSTAADIAPAGFDRYSFWGIVSPRTYDKETLPPDDPTNPGTDPDKPKTDWKLIALIVLASLGAIFLVWTLIFKKKSGNETN